MIVITAPTGRIGGKLVRELAGDAEPVRVVARDPARLAPDVRDRVEVVRGSLDDPGVVAAAYAGADALFWLAPPDPRATSIDGHVLGLTGTTCAAIAAQGVKHVVGVSTLGRGVAKNAGQISAALAMDEMIMETGVHYRALCMPGFMENTLAQAGPIRDQGVFYGLLPGGLAGPTCATRDIAAVAARLLRDRTWTGQEDVQVLGPEDLAPDDMAAIMSDVLGRPVRYQRVPAEGYLASLTAAGMSEEWARGLVDMTTAVEAGIYDGAVRTPASSTPTTFRQWCAEELKPVVDGEK